MLREGDLVRLVRKITPYEAPQEGTHLALWHTIQPGEAGILVERLNSLEGLFLFGEARVVARMEMFEVLSATR